MHDDAKRLAALIERMASTAREHAAASRGRAWWVLLCGGALDADDFDQRERMREGLAEVARELGLVLSEHIWVWDDRNRAQLVVGRHATRELALEESGRLAERIRALGRHVEVRVMEELEEGRG